MDELTQQIQARLAELPLDVRQAVESADLDAHVQTIGNKHQLHIDQTGKLQNETLLVMLGFTSTADFVGNLAAHVGVPAEKATAIAADVNNEIFSPIRESLKKISGQAPAQPAAAPVAPPRPPITSMSVTPPSAAAPKPAVPVPSVPPVTTKPPASMPPPAPQTPATPAAKPQVPLAPHPHDLMLVEKTVTTPATPPKSPASASPAPASVPPAPPKPDNYKSDPYREPVEP